MAELTYAVSVFTKGMLSLRSVSLGVLRVDSHHLLEDGIRQELVKKVTLALHKCLTFDAKSKVFSKKNSLFKLLQVVLNGLGYTFILFLVSILNLIIFANERNRIHNFGRKKSIIGRLLILGRNLVSLPYKKCEIFPF